MYVPVKVAAVVAADVGVEEWGAEVGVAEWVVEVAVVVRSGVGVVSTGTKRQQFAQ